MFGFGRLASYDYFSHLRRAMVERMKAAGVEAEGYVVDVSPTASIRRRAAKLAETVARTCDAESGDAGPIHLVGHSTGGLDARLVASPNVSLPVEAGALDWLPRLRSVTTMSAPHYGTPIAKFFATAKGQHMLYAISALTVIGLTLGAPPLAAASALVVAVGRLDRALGLEIRTLDRATDALLKVLGDVRGREVRSYLSAIKDDQGAVLQLTPEAMELFQASTDDRPGVFYQSSATMAPPPTPVSIVKSIETPWSVASAGIFAALHSLASRLDDTYPCAAPYAGDKEEAMLVNAFGRAPGARANDGVVPLRSQIYGKLAWIGMADHLDVLGHFGGEPEDGHRDWLASGAGFRHEQFSSMCDALTKGMLEAST